MVFKKTAYVMSFVRITRIFTFEAAHLLRHHDGLCRNIHGHSYRLEVCAGGEPFDKPGDSKDGMVWDFACLKKVVTETVLDRVDHALLMNRQMHDDLHDLVTKMDLKVLWLPFEPTSENMVSFFAEALSGKMPPGVRLISLKLYETATSFAGWEAEDQHGDSCKSDRKTEQ